MCTFQTLAYVYSEHVWVRLKESQCLTRARSIKKLAQIDWVPVDLYYSHTAGISKKKCSCVIFTIFLTLDSHTVLSCYQ